MKPRVFITRPIPRPVLDRLGARCELEVYPEDTRLPEAKLIEGCREAEGVVVVGARVSEELLRQAVRLRIVANSAVGYDNIDVEACTRRKIPVTNTPGVLDDATADMAFALLMAAARRVVEGDRMVREGRWREWQWGLLHGADLWGKTLGLYGFGRIGRAMARRGRGFSMRILYHTRRRVPEAIERETGACHVERDTLLRESDFLSLHVPLTPETRHAIAARELGLMKPTAFLVNTARGPVVDEEALVGALKEKRIAGAGLDVFEREPQVHPELIKLDNVVLMPHVGSATAGTRLRMAETAADNLLAALEGRRPPNVVNPEVYGR